MPITFEAGAVFKIVDEMSPQLRLLTRRMIKFNDVVERTTKSLATFGRGQLDVFATMNGSISEAIASTKLLSDEWKNVAASAQAAATSIEAARITGPSTSVFRPGKPIPRHGAGPFGMHSNIGLPLPVGDAHIYGHSTAALIGAGALAYGAYEESEFEDAAFRAMYTAGIPADPAERQRRMKQLRDIIQHATTTTGRPIGDIEEATLTGIRQFAGMPWDARLKILPDLLQGAAAEAVLKGKGTSVEEGMEVYTGLAHMTKEYSPEEIKKLIPVFAYLSTVDPEKIKQMQKAASYAVPILQSSLDIDPTDTLLLVAALQRGGITNTKAGTWIRNMAIRAMPGTSLMSKTAFEKHEAALRAFGLVDDRGNPTWFTDGKPDIIKLLDIAGTNEQKIPLTKRAAYQQQLFGAQGSGAEAVLSDPRVINQIHILRGEMAKFKTGVTFFEDYYQNSPIQKFRTGWADLQKTLMDIGTTVLPPVVMLLQGFDAGLKGLNQVLGTGVMATIISAGVGALAGAKFGPAGAVIGASAGALLPNLITPEAAATKDKLLSFLGLGNGPFSFRNLWNDLTKSTSGIGPAAQSAASSLDALRQAIENLKLPTIQKSSYLGAVQSPKWSQPLQIHTALNVDRRKLADAVTYVLAREGAGPVGGSPYHDSTYSTTPVDFVLA